METGQAETQERTLEILLNWPRSWLVRERSADGKSVEHWLPKDKVRKLRDEGPQHSRFAIPTAMLNEWKKL